MNRTGCNEPLCSRVAVLAFVLVLGEAAGAESTPSANLVPPYGIVQFGFGKLHDPEVFHFLRRCHVNLWECPALAPVCSNYGWGDLTSFKAKVQEGSARVRRGRHGGITVVSPIPYHAIYGDEKKRTAFFSFYDKYWDEYQDYLGPRPPDPIEWAKRLADGSPKPFLHRASPGYWICPNNPYWLQYLNGCLHILADAGFDGVRLDGPTGPCWCKFCEAAFVKWLQATYTPEELAQHFGMKDIASAKPPTRMNEPLQFLWRRYCMFRKGETVAEAAAAVREYNPDFLMSYNYNIGKGLVRGSAPQEYLSVAGNYTLAEGNYNATAHSENGRKHSASADCKYLLASGDGKPVDLHYYLYPCGRDGPQGIAQWSQEKVEEHAVFWRAAIAEGMFGGCPYPIMSKWAHPNAWQAIINCTDFFYRRRPYLTAARTYANVAILASVSQTWAALPTYPLSLSRFLADKHIPHTMIIEGDLRPDRLQQYDALVLPEARLLNEEHAEVISDFVTGGKGLVAFGPVGTRNKYNEEQPTSSLGELLEIEGRAFGSSPFRRPAGRGRVAWFPSPELPVSGRWPLPDRSLEHLSGLVEALSWAAGGRFSGYLNAPEMVELNLMRSPDGRLLLAHLMNYNVELSARVTAYENIRLAVALPSDADVQRVLLFSPDLPQEKTQLETEVVDWQGRRLLVATIPRIEVYNLVAVVLKGAKLPAMPADGPIPVTLNVSGRPRATPGEKLALDIVVANRSRIDIEGTCLQLTAPQGRKASVTSTALVPGIPAGTEKSVAFELIVPDKARPEVHRDVDLEAELRLSTGQTTTLTTRHRVFVAAPLELSLKVTKHVDPSARRVQLEVGMANITERELEGTLVLELPSDWRAEADQHGFDLAGGEKKHVVLTAAAPLETKPGTYRVVVKATYAVDDRSYSTKAACELEIQSESGAR